MRAGWDDGAWREALLADLEYEAAATPGHHLSSIFLGGGTPSLMPPATVAAFIARATELWPAPADLEITLEANPTSVEAARFAGFAAAGVNRVSLGIQALDDATLRFLGRPHDLEQGMAALDIAQATFARVSFDLITARPGQSPDAWERELSRALALGTGHLSLYQLTIEPGTHFATLARQGRLTLPDEDTARELWDRTQALTASAGLPAYETSNHARPGEEGRHNLAYWTYAPHVGIGPGAHGRRGSVATVRHRLPERWLRGVAETGHGVAEETRLDAPARAREALVMGLRLVRGVERGAFARRTGVELVDAVVDGAAARMAALGLVEHDATGLRLTAEGRPLLDAVLAELAR